jgi:hypothetical protein
VLAPSALSPLGIFVGRLPHPLADGGGKVGRFYVKIKEMKPEFPENQLSYQKHRRQLWLQILLPLLVGLILILAVAVLTGIVAFGESGDAYRWAAISTIWLVIPIMVFGLIVLAILIGIVYLLARTLKVIPPYSSQAQYYVNRGASEVKRFSDMAAKPVLFIEGIMAGLKTIFGKN